MHLNPKVYIPLGLAGLAGGFCLQGFQLKIQEDQAQRESKIARNALKRQKAIEQESFHLRSSREAMVHRPKPTPCDEAKANFRSSLFHVPMLPAGNDLRSSLYIPLDKCQGHKEEIVHLNKIMKCMDSKGNTDKECLDLSYDFRTKYCFTPGVEVATERMLNYLEGIPYDE